MVEGNLHLMAYTLQEFAKLDLSHCALRIPESVWPACAKCGTRVNHVSVDMLKQDPPNRLLKVSCHGEESTREVPEILFKNAVNSVQAAQEILAILTLMVPGGSKPLEPRKSKMKREADWDF